MTISTKSSEKNCFVWYSA